METINGEWYMQGCDASDPNRLKTADDLLCLIRKIGFLPLFANEITGFSVEERTTAESWWSGDTVSDPWEWRIVLSAHPEIAYGKFFDKKAGFIHKDFFPAIANFRRNGYDFDALSDEGLVSARSKKIMDVFALDEEAVGKEIMSNELKEMAGFGKDGGEKNFNGILTELQMQTYLIVSAFRQRVNKKGDYYGWHLAALETPETKWGYKFVSSSYKEEPSASWEKIVERVRCFFPDADEKDIQKLLGIRYPGAETPIIKAPAKHKKPKYQWPENLLRTLKDLPIELDDDQMKGLCQAILMLKPREQEIIKLYYEEYKTQAEIAETIGVSATRISQIRQKTLRILKHPSKSDFIRYGYQETLRRKAEAAEKANKDCKTINKLDLSIRVHDILINAGITKIEQIETLIRTDPDKLLSIPRLGKMARAELISSLENVGIDVSVLRERVNK